MLLYWIILTIQIIILVVSIVVYVNKKQWFALFILIADICSITLTYFTQYEKFPWTKEIYYFAQVDYSATGYNEGRYYGGWEDEYPQGYGRLTYNHFVDDKFYAIIDVDGAHRAIYYEGEFDHGSRVGHGTVVYESGYKDEGEFYGKWEPGKIVFEGRRWKDEKYYANLKIIARDAISADDIYETEYWLTE